MLITSSTHKFTDPIRFFKSNDPVYWEMENIPLSQLQENDRWLKDQIENFSNQGNVSRSDFAELKPFVTGSDNVIHVNPGKFTARINDAYNKDALQKVKLVQEYIAGNFRQYTNQGNFSTTQFDEVIRRIQSATAADALNMNGLAERVFQIRVADTDRNLTTVTFGNSPNTGVNTEIDKWPVTYISPFRKYFTQQLGSFTDLQKLESEFIKMWRGVARTAIVNLDSELTIEIPAFDINDFQSNDPDTGSVTIVPATTRIDLVFIYSHPIDASSTALFNYTNGVPQTITEPILGLVRGAGVVVKKLSSTSPSVYPNVTTPPLDDDGNPQILASPADQNNANNGFKLQNIHGSFPSPDDLMNITPNLIENLESTDVQLMGQTILPICYVVVRGTALVNNAGQPVVTDSDVIDIRPFFRTTELSYNERAGIAAATPQPSLGNPVVTQFQLEQHLNQLYSRVTQQTTGTETLVPRVVAGGTIWGGTTFGAEGAVRAAAKLLAGIADANLPYQAAPSLPDWDLAEWWSLYSPNVNDPGQRRNDRINMYRSPAGSFDSGTNLTTATNINTAERRIGTWNYHGIGNSLTFYWVKKEILFDRSAVPWMADYTVDCELLNCTAQTNLSSRSGTDFHSEESFPTGIWVEKKLDRFIIYMAWAADPPSNSGAPQTIHAREPRLDRDTYGFSGFVVRHSDMGLPSSDNISYDNIPAKAPHLGACTYPSVSFKVTGFPAGFYYSQLQQYPAVSLITLQ